MNSEIDIFNAALIEIGQTPLLGPVDDSKEARLCNYRYPEARNSTLRSHFWNCAMTRTELAKLANGPSWGYANYYQLPVDCLRVKEAEGSSEIWKVEGRKLATDGDFIKILYVAEIVNVPDFDELLSSCIAMRLAASIAYAMTRNEKLSSMLFQKWLDSIAEARYIDSLEQKGEYHAPIAYTGAHGGGAIFRGIS